MNAPASPLFRGARAVADVIERMRPLAEHLKSFHPDCTTLTLSQRDMAVLYRYPDAAREADIVVTDAGMYWQRFELRTERPRPRTP